MAQRNQGAKPPQKTIRELTLDAAKAAVCGSRDVAYGKPESNFARIAAFWQAWIDGRYGPTPVVITEGDVASMLDLVKTGRLAGNLGHRDSWIDKAGYAACGAEVTNEHQR